MGCVPNIPGCAAGCFSSFFDLNKIQNNVFSTRLEKTGAKAIYIEVNNEWVNREGRKHLKYKNCIAYALLASYRTTKKDHKTFPMVPLTNQSYYQPSL